MSRQTAPLAFWRPGGRREETAPGGRREETGREEARVEKLQK